MIDTCESSRNDFAIPTHLAARLLVNRLKAAGVSVNDEVHERWMSDGVLLVTWPGAYATVSGCDNEFYRPMVDIISRDGVPLHTAMTSLEAVIRAALDIEAQRSG